MLRQTSDAGPPLLATLWVLTVAVAGMGALLAFLPAAGHDQLWILYVARHLLDGAPLYGREFFESNPPLNIWLSTVPVALAGILHLPAPAVAKLLVLMLEVSIAFLALRLLRSTLPAMSRTQVAALAFAFITVFNVIPARDLGQREHVLTLLCLPYLLSAANWLWRPGTAGVLSARAVLIGLLAGVGLAIKPHQTVLCVAIELYLILRTRSLRSLLRPEPLMVVLCGVSYIAAIHRFTPAFLTDVLPLLRETYWAVGSLTLPQLVVEAWQLHVLAVAAAVLCLRRRPESALVPVFLVAGLASTLAYYLQGTGWYYQQLPAISFFTFALVFAMLPLAARPVPAWTPKAALALSVLALALTTHFTDYPFTEARSFPVETPDPAFFSDLPPGTAVATITTTVDYTVMPAARYGLTIAQRYPHLWMLPAILRNEDPGAGTPPRRVIPPDRLAELAAVQHRFMVEDLERWQPPLVLVERCHKAAVHCQLLEDRDDDLLAWFLRDPAFAAEWQNYTFAGSRGRFDAYTRTPTR